MQVSTFNLVTSLQIMLSNVTHSNFYFECNKERGPIDQLYIELGEIVWKFWEFFNRMFFGGIFWEIFFGRIFLGEIT